MPLHWRRHVEMMHRPRPQSHSGACASEQWLSTGAQKLGFRSQVDGGSPIPSSAQDNKNSSTTATHLIAQALRTFDLSSTPWRNLDEQPSELPSPRHCG